MNDLSAFSLICLLFFCFQFLLCFLFLTTGDRLCSCNDARSISALYGAIFSQFFCGLWRLRLCPVSDLLGTCGLVTQQMHSTLMDAVVARYRHYFLWSPYLIGQTIIFSSCGFFLLLSFFYSSPNLSSRRLDVYQFRTWCGLSANLECRSEMYCTRLAGNARRKNRQKIAVWAPWHNFVGSTYRQSGKIMLNSSISSMSSSSSSGEIFRVA